MSEDFPSPNLPELLEKGLKAQSEDICVVFLEAPQFTSPSTWKTLNQRLEDLFSFSLKTEREILPVICPPLERPHREWANFLGATLWPWDERGIEERTNFQNLQRQKTSSFDSFFKKTKQRTSKNEKEKRLIGFFSSGSTGRPKIILHQKTSLVQSAKVSGKILNLKKENQSVLYSSLPFFHVGGFLTGLRSELFQTPLYTQESYQFTEGLLKLEERDIVVIGVPTQIDLIKGISSKLKEKGKKITFYAGGDKVKTDHWNALKDIGQLISTYGQSESCGAILYQEGLEAETKTFEDVKVLINKDGLLSYKTSRLALATLGLLEESEGDFRGLQIEEHNLHDFFETQDLVREVLLENGNKQLHILGRADGLFQCGGEMISPKELEDQFRKLLLIEKKLTSYADRLELLSLQGMPDPMLGKIPVLFLKGLEFNEVKELAKALAPHNKGTKKIRAMAIYPEVKGIKPSIYEFQESYRAQSIGI